MILSHKGLSKKKKAVFLDSPSNYGHLRTSGRLIQYPEATSTGP